MIYYHKGLSNICFSLLGKRICKKNQLSNWDQRPLNKKQIKYAALDSYILLEIFEKLNNDSKYKELIKL